jgi:hypothetical protein
MWRFEAPPWVAFEPLVFLEFSAFGKGPHVTCGRCGFGCSPNLFVPSSAGTLANFLSPPIVFSFWENFSKLSSSILFVEADPVAKSPKFLSPVLRGDRKRKSFPMTVVFDDSTFSNLSAGIFFKDPAPPKMTALFSISKETSLRTDGDAFPRACLTRAISLGFPDLTLESMALINFIASGESKVCECETEEFLEIEPMVR